MAATAALSAATVAELVPLGSDRFAAMTAALAITTGIAALLAGVLRLGFLANFISEPVLKGFIVGLALTILIGQVPKLLGISKGTGDFFQQLWHVLTHLGDTQGAILLVGALSLAVILALRRFAPAVPGSLVAVGLGHRRGEDLRPRPPRSRDRGSDQERAADVRVPECRPARHRRRWPRAGSA